jgi:ABC-type transport system involved in multi-copper enzyme maturation permease subunit
VLLFNMLVGPVFSAGSVTSERERQTLDLLLVTLVTPWQMLWGKLLSGLRVSSVLTAFLLWPVVLAIIMIPLGFMSHLPTMIGYFLIVALSCLTTAMTALFCSTVFHKSATSLICTYLVITVMFVGPLAARFFADTFFQGRASTATVEKLGIMSPFAATFALPLEMKSDDGKTVAIVSNADADLVLFFGYVLWALVYNGLLLLAMMRLFQVRWRVAD